MALFGTTRVSRYQKDKSNLDFTEARKSEWQWHQLGQDCTSPETDNHVTTKFFLQAGCIKALKATITCVHINIDNCIQGSQNAILETKYIKKIHIQCITIEINVPKAAKIRNNLCQEWPGKYTSHLIVYYGI